MTELSRRQKRIQDLEIMLTQPSTPLFPPQTIPMDAEKTLDELLKAYRLASMYEQPYAAKRIHAHVSAAVQEANKKYEWLCKHHLEITFFYSFEPPTPPWGFNQRTEANPRFAYYPSLDALVTAEIARLNHPQETE